MVGEQNVGWQPAGKLHATLHTGSHNHRLKNQIHGATVKPDAHDAFHVYDVEVGR